LAWTLDKTGTINNLQFLSIQEKPERYALIEQQEKNRVREFGLPDEVLWVHGVATASKGEGIIHLIYKNMNGISNKMSNNDKLEKAKEIHDELEVDIAAYNEHRLNLRHRLNVNGFNQMFKGGEVAIQSVTAHNTHENIGCVQEGGTSLLAFGTVTEYLDHHQLGKDKTGLGRWSIMTFKGDNRVQKRVVCGYNPCYDRNLNSSTSYQQHRRYFIRQQKELTCLRTKFCEDLVSQLLRWQQDGDKLIVCLDANEDIYCKSIEKALTDINGLAMKEVVGDFTHQRVGVTFFRGSKPINGVWATSDILVCQWIKSGRIPFLPKASLWIKQTQVYRSLLKYHAGKIRNRGNLKQAAQHCKIQDAMSISIKEIMARLSTCINMCDHFRKHRQSYRRRHLQQRLSAAKEKEDEEAKKQILAIIQREKDRSFWRHINYVLGKRSSGPCFKVQVPQEDGGVVEHTSQDNLQNATWMNIHRKRFYLADEAPLCSGNLCEMFGYNAMSGIARLVFASTYEYPPDFNQATKEIFEECARI
jgi:hypothetical protein